MRWESFRIELSPYFRQLNVDPIFVNLLYHQNLWLYYLSELIYFYYVIFCCFYTSTLVCQLVFLSNTCNDYLIFQKIIIASMCMFLFQMVLFAYWLTHLFKMHSFLFFFNVPVWNEHVFPCNQHTGTILGWWQEITRHSIILNWN